MGLKKTRLIVSIILTVVISISTLLMLFSFVLSSTFSAQSYLTKHLITDEIVAECETQLDMKYEALEIKSGIPARVFEIVKDDFKTEDSLMLAVQYIFGDESTTLYNQEKIDYFYKLCTEYLDGNEISYKKKDVELAADEAAKIYSECVGIHNADAIVNYLPEFNRNCARVGSTALFALVMSLILLVIMYKKREKAYSYTASGVAAGSIATALVSLLCIVTNVGSKFNFSPAVYQQSFAGMTKLFFVILMVVAIIFVIVAYLGFVLIDKKYLKDQFRKETRFSKIVSRL